MRTLLRFPILVALAGALVACAGEEAPPADESCCEEALPLGPLPDTSIYQLESTWTDQDGTSVKLASFRGRPMIVAMMFTSCEYACPRLLADLKAIEAGLPRGAAPGFLLVSFDAERDLPAVLKAYAAEKGLTPGRWTLLHGRAQDVRELAAVLGIKYKKSDTVGFSHSNVITLLDADGRVRHQQTGLGAAPTGLLAALRKAGD